MRRAPRLLFQLMFLAVIALTAVASMTFSSRAAAVDTNATGDINRRLVFLAFADDGSRALVLERSGFGPFNEAAWIVDASGVVEVLPFGQRGATTAPGVTIGAGRKDRDTCRDSAVRLSDMAADFDQVSVRVGMCGSASGPIVTPMKTWAPLVASADLGVLHQRVGMAGRTFIAPRGPTRETGPLVVVIGQDALGNDRVGVTTSTR